MRDYTSVVYDLTSFGVFNIKNAIITSDMDDGINISVSFNNGKTFYKVKELNKKFPVFDSNGKIQVKIIFKDLSSYDIYKVKAAGSLNLEIGTTIYFTRKSKLNRTYSTNIGECGKYTIFLPRGIYEVWHNGPKGNKIILFPEYNPELFRQIYSTNGLDKENIVEMFLRGNTWAKYAIFDIFTDDSKMKSGSLFIDMDGNLTDGITNRKVKYWAIGFD